MKYNWKKRIVQLIVRILERKKAKKRVSFNPFTFTMLKSKKQFDKILSERIIFKIRKNPQSSYTVLLVRFTFD